MFCFRNAKFLHTAPCWEREGVLWEQILWDLLQAPVAYSQLTLFALQLICISIAVMT